MKSGCLLAGIALELFLSLETSAILLVVGIVSIFWAVLHVLLLESVAILLIEEYSIFEQVGVPVFMESICNESDH